jgi:hypothetical protein
MGRDRGVLLAGAVALLVVALAGCGDDDSGGGLAPSPRTEARISKAEFARRGDELCREFSKVRDLVAEQIDATADPGEQARLLRKIAGASEEALRGFDAMPKPERDQDELARYLGTARENLVLVRRAAEALDEGKGEEAHALLQNAADASEKANRIAQGYGFKACG